MLGHETRQARPSWCVAPQWLRGGAIGAAIGIIYPELLYYADEPDEPDTGEDARRSWRLVPALGDHKGIGLITEF